ncbi:MAG: hypothetical protein ACLQJR_34560 [Stellaceae bacterium]
MIVYLNLHRLPIAALALLLFAHELSLGYLEQDTMPLLSLDAARVVLIRFDVLPPSDHDHDPEPNSQPPRAETYARTTTSSGSVSSYTFFPSG